MKQQPYRNEDGHVVFPSPGASEVEEWPFPPLTPEEILEAGGDPSLYDEDYVAPEPIVEDKIASLFDQVSDEVSDDDPEDDPEDDEQ